VERKDMRGGDREGKRQRKEWTGDRRGTGREGNRGGRAGRGGVGEEKGKSRHTVGAYA